MKRRIAEKLEQWKNDKNRKPLIVQGARQVGKTYSVLDFGRQCYEDVVSIDFSRDAWATTLFEGDIEPAAVINNLELRFGKTILPGKTLVFLDEIQLCDRALTSLKYFCDQAPQYHVVAAGSLLGIALNRQKHSFPVGKVDNLELHPLDFEEYLYAMGFERLAEAIAQAYRTPKEAFAGHDLALEQYRKYLLVGGMPEVVARAVDGASPMETRNHQLRVENDYIADMTKYADVADSAKILAIWRSLGSQLIKKNPKFQYKAVKRGARAREYWSSAEWLQAAGMVQLCTQVSEGIAPLAAFENPLAFKMYLEDTGLLAAKLGAQPQMLTSTDPKTARFRGAIAENYCMQQLVARGIHPYYWGTTSVAEVDFLVQDASGNAVPIEVKSGTNTTSNSRKTFSNKYHPERFVVASARNFGVEGSIAYVPLYAMWCLANDMAGITRYLTVASEM